jgi:hypothetical protein
MGTDDEENNFHHEARCKKGARRCKESGASEEAATARRDHRR